MISRIRSKRAYSKIIRIQRHLKSIWTGKRKCYSRDHSKITPFWEMLASIVASARIRPWSSNKAMKHQRTFITYFRRLSIRRRPVWEALTKTMLAPPAASWKRATIIPTPTMLDTISMTILRWFKKRQISKFPMQYGTRRRSATTPRGRTSIESRKLYSINKRKSITKMPSKIAINWRRATTTASTAITFTPIRARMNLWKLSIRTKLLIHAFLLWRL